LKIRELLKKRERIRLHLWKKKRRRKRKRKKRREENANTRESAATLETHAVHGTAETHASAGHDHAIVEGETAPATEEVIEEDVTAAQATAGIGEGARAGGETAVLVAIGEEVLAADAIEVPAVTEGEARASSVTEEAPALNVIDEVPALSVIDEVLVLSVIDEVPAGSVIDEVPAGSVIDEVRVVGEIGEALLQSARKASAYRAFRSPLLPRD